MGKIEMSLRCVHRPLVPKLSSSLQVLLQRPVNSACTCGPKSELLSWHRDIFAFWLIKCSCLKYVRVRRLELCKWIAGSCEKGVSLLH